MKTNRMKARLRAGEAVFGVSVMIPSPEIVELMAMAAEASGITSIARPATKSPEHILQVLDRGVMGVQVPHVNTPEEAREVIEAVKYHPLGKRGLAAGTRAAV